MDSDSGGSPAASTPPPRAASRLKAPVRGATPLLPPRSARKPPPLGPTPSQRKLPRRSPSQEDLDPQKVAFLLHKQWTLYSVTPLYNFSYTNLKEYSNLLSAFIAAEKQKGLAVEVGEDLNVKVIFSALLGIKGTQRDPDALLVQILCHKYLIGVLAYLTELAVFQIE
ncbi:centromere protein L [Pteronotus mesoamericanus]|uniref:centromere protein L n=1 Tax=Pteronotus mesoamericanus TaxID=1884717 RepID=UPI0023ED9D3F|nr:centromere protein L [Pteronotus parnellii mesoamericanus]